MTLYNLCLPEVVTVIMTVDTQTLTQSPVLNFTFLYIIFTLFLFLHSSGLFPLHLCHSVIAQYHHCRIACYGNILDPISLSGTVMLQKHFDITVTECDVSDRNLPCTILLRHKTLSQRSQRVSAPTATVCSVKLSYHSA